MTAGTGNIVILGSGMAGLGAAHCLRAEGLSSTLYDKNSYPGGHTASHHASGFIFDEGPHVSFTRNERIRQLFAESVGGDYQAVNAAVNNYWQGHWVRHPAITNLHGLPPELVVRIIQDFIDRPRDPEVHNYADWLNASYGETFARTFPMQYTRKYHTTPAENMSTEWVGPRLYQAQLEEVLLGAVSPALQRVHYVQDYRYPTRGGFASFLTGLTRDHQIELEHRVTAIDPRTRTIRFANGSEAGYSHLISSMPLPELVPLVAGAPREVLDAVEQLACTSVVLVNIGIARPDVSQASWTYFYDAEFPFSRISFPAVYSPQVVPEGASSIQAEVYFSKKYQPLTQTPESLIDPVIEGLTRAGVMRPDDRILLRQAQLIPYANIIFDLDRAAALRVVHGYLDEIGIAPCGRYGEWGYQWTDEAFLSGEAAARKVLDRAVAPAGGSVTQASPRVSIAVPVYNGERYVAQALDSLLGQTYTDFELVIVDNCSTDGTEDICRSFASRDQRVRYFRNERNIGGPGNFRRSFMLSRGEFHKWSTADDYWEPTVVEKCVALLDADPQLVLAYPRTRLVTHDGTLIREHDDHLHLMDDSPAKRMRRVLDTTTFCHAHLGVLRRSAMLRTALIGTELASDIRFLAELSLYGKFAVVPEYLFYRRFHEDCSSWDRSNMDRQRAYYDPGRSTVFGMHTWRRYAHLTAAAFRAPLGARERTRVIKSLGRRLMWHSKALWREVKGMGHAR